VGLVLRRLRRWWWLGGSDALEQQSETVAPRRFVERFADELRQRRQYRVEMRVHASLQPRHHSYSRASAHRGKWGQLTPLEKWMKNYKKKTCKKDQFSMFMLYFDSNQGRQV